jgi:hypothetical protein
VQPALGAETAGALERNERHFRSHHHLPHSLLDYHDVIRGALADRLVESTSTKPNVADTGRLAVESASS